MLNCEQPATKNIFSYNAYINTISHFLCCLMSLFISSLNSGSNGNCYYVGNNDEAILVDVGISCREVEKRLVRLGTSIHKIKAIFISHEHSDHIRGLSVLSQKYQLPVYITSATLANGRIALENNLVKSFCSEEPVCIGGLTVYAFAKHHDAADPYSFLVSCNNTRVGVFTDIGKPCHQLISYFKTCNAAFLEANYDEAMLTNGNYPYHLKARIRGGNGHLSNVQALDIFKNHRSPQLTHLFLAHLSKNNNCPVLVQNLFTDCANGVQVIIAGRYQETPMYHVVSTTEAKPGVRRFTRPTQLSFVFN